MERVLIVPHLLRLWASVFATLEVHVPSQFSRFLRQRRDATEDISMGISLIIKSFYCRIKRSEATLYNRQYLNQHELNKLYISCAFQMLATIIICALLSRTCHLSVPCCIVSMKSYTIWMLLCCVDKMLAVVFTFIGLIWINTSYLTVMDCFRVWYNCLVVDFQISFPNKTTSST